MRAHADVELIAFCRCNTARPGFNTGHDRRVPDE